MFELIKKRFNLQNFVMDMRSRLKQFNKLEIIKKNPKQLKTEAEISKIRTKQSESESSKKTSIQNFQAIFCQTLSF